MNTTNTAAAGRAQESELREALLELRPRLLRSAGFSMIAGLLTLMSTWYMFEVYDRVVNSRSLMTLAMLTLMVVAAFVVMEILEWTHNEEMARAAVDLDHKLADRVFDASFEANLKRIPGGSTLPHADLRTLREFLPSQVLKSFAELPVALVFLIVIFLLSPWLGIAALAGAVLQTLVAWMNERSTQPPLAAANRAAFGAQQYADGSLRNAQVIEAMGMLRDIHARWLKKQREFLTLQAGASENAGVFTAMSKFLQTLLASLLLGLGAWLMMHGQLTGGGGAMIVASVLGGRVLQPLVQLVSQWRTLVNARVAYARLNALFTALPKRSDSMALPVPHGHITAENIVVPPPGGQGPILKGLNFAAQPGEVVAVIGPSASGKTTLARVLTGVWPSIGGKARLDGADIYAWNKAELGPHVGYLPQGVELFDGTIAENIARFGVVDMAKVQAAAHAVGLHEMISALPEGYETELGPEGARLSGGQRQRVGLARAIYGNPVFVVLDEPNSSLDEAGDAALLHAIAQEKARGTTFVVITHRTGLMKVCDKILLLRDGMQVAFGPRDDIMAALAKANQEQARPHPQAVRALPAQPEVAA